MFRFTFLIVYTYLIESSFVYSVKVAHHFSLSHEDPLFAGIIFGIHIYFVITLTFTLYDTKSQLSATLYL